MQYIWRLRSILASSNNSCFSQFFDLKTRRTVSRFAPFWSAFVRAPLATAALAVSGCVLFVATAFAGIAAISLFPQALGSPTSWLVLTLFWWGGALWTGVSLVSIAPKRGMTACLAL